MIYPNFHENVCICGKVLILWKIGIPFWKYSPAAVGCVACGRLHQTSVLEFPLSTSTPPPLIFHGHPVTRRGGKTWHAVNILGDFIFYVWVILGQTLQTDRVQFSCWCHDDSTIQCSGKSRDKDQGMRGRGWARASKCFTVTGEGRPSTGLVFVESTY